MCLRPSQLRDERALIRRLALRMTDGLLIDRISERRNQTQRNSLLNKAKTHYLITTRSSPLPGKTAHFTYVITTRSSLLPVGPT